MMIIKLFIDNCFIDRLYNFSFIISYRLCASYFSNNKNRSHTFETENHFVHDCEKISKAKKKQ